MWIDTHCHLDAAEFGSGAGDIAAGALARGVGCIVIPAIARDNFSTVAQLAATNSNCAYALGIHPIFVPRAHESDLDVLRETVKQSLGDPRFVAIGEIGLDFFVPGLDESPMREKQEHFFSEQLKIARDAGLPALVHIRRSQDIVLKHLRRIELPGGIAHAFNGSHQQAKTFIELGFKLGFGGAMTFPRALQIRRLAVDMPADAIVMETDAPDIPPAWIHKQRNSPEQLPRIGEEMAALRGVDPDEWARVTSENARTVMPRLSAAFPR